MPPFSSQPQMPRRCAFLIEDNPTIRANLIPTLAEMADVMVVGTAEGEHDAMAWLCAHADDQVLVILDLFLAQGSGIGVLKQMKQLQMSKQVVVLTNFATPDIRGICAELGAVALFDKSTELDAFFDFCLASDSGGAITRH